MSANLDPTGFVGDDDTPTDTEEPEAEEVSPFREAYNRLSPDGPAHGDVVMEKLASMWQVEPQIEAATLARVRVPTLILAGQHDSIRTDHTLEIARAIPGAQVAIVPGAGHTVMLERPEVVNLLLLEFLASSAASDDPLGRSNS